MPYADRTLSCVDCNSQFVFTAGEQEFHSSKGFSNDPRRCPSCRQSRKSSRNDSSGDRPHSSGSMGGGFSSGGGMPRREMFDAVCAECGKDTQVPFQPSGSRPVYCRDCFSQHSGGSGGGGGRSSYGGGGGGGGGGRSSRSARY